MGDPPSRPEQDTQVITDKTSAMPRSGSSSPPPNSAAKEAAPLSRRGKMIDHFKVIRLLGHGGMGRVYLARDTKLGRKVALKLIHRALLDDRATERFITEARTTAKFNHPHIVTIHAVGEYDGEPYLAFEFLEGANLRQRLSERRLSLQESLRIGLAVAEALAEAHGHGVLHRDLKPANVVIPRDGRLRVVDFGLAQRMAGQKPYSDELVDPANMDDKRTWLGGTPAYMAPEQWREEECTGAADIWAFGVMLFEMCAARRPYVEDGLAQHARAVASDEPAVAVETCADVPAAVAKLINACLAKCPDDPLQLLLPRCCTEHSIRRGG